MSKKNQPAPAATPTPTVIPAAAPAPQTTDQAAAPALDDKVQVRSTCGLFINPFTNEHITAAEGPATLDNWLQSQIDAGKIEKV